MCGITGLFDLMGRRLIDKSLLRRMTNRIQHRGPDGEGYLIEPGIGLGHRRLAIVDLLSGGQPIWNETKDIGVVFNGEIYNFQDLVEQLIKHGHTFCTRSDTEVIVHAWEQWGKDCVSHFNGMFAFALWDRNQKTLFLARDRLGKKPIYYATLPDGHLAFASELKALLEIPSLPQILDERAIEDYFALGYIPDPRSIFRSVRKLPPAHTLTVCPGAGLKIERYWQVSCIPDSHFDEGSAKEALLTLLEQAVKSRLIADVPLGAFLSGGVDSSAVVSLMARACSDPVKTFTIGFKEAQFDESNFAAEIAAQYGTNHLQSTLTTDLLEVVDNLPGIYDEPFGDSSALPTLLVCEMAKRHVTVALSGDAGDELFAGYRRYKFHAREAEIRALLPSFIRGPIFGMLGQYYPKLDSMPKVFRAKTTFKELALSNSAGYFFTASTIKTDIRQKLYSAEFFRQLHGYTSEELISAAMDESGSDDPVTAAQYTDLVTYLPGDILTKVDRASMAMSLEVRSPMLDHRFVEFAFRLPRKLKIAGGMQKAILKKALQPLVPHQLLYRQKQGFSIPLAQWFRGPMRGRLFDAIESSALADSHYLDQKVLRRLFNQHVSGNFDHSQALWLVYGFSKFLSHLAGEKPSPALAAAG